MDACAADLRLSLWGLRSAPGETWRTGAGWCHCGDWAAEGQGVQSTEQLPSGVSLGLEGEPSLCLWINCITFPSKRGIIAPENQNPPCMAQHNRLQSAVAPRGVSLGGRAGCRVGILALSLTAV